MAARLLSSVRNASSRSSTTVSSEIRERIQTSPSWYAYKAFADVVTLTTEVRQREEEYDVKLSALYSQIYRVRNELIQEKERHALFLAEGVARTQSLARMEDELTKTADVIAAAETSFRARLSHLEDSRLSTSIIELDASRYALIATRAQLSDQQTQYDSQSAAMNALEAEKDGLKKSLRGAKNDIETQRNYAAELLAELLLEREKSRVLEEKLTEAEGLFTDSIPTTADPEFVLEELDLSAEVDPAAVIFACNSVEIEQTTTFSERFVVNSAHHAAAEQLETALTENALFRADQSQWRKRRAEWCDREAALSAQLLRECEAHTSTLTDLQSIQSRFARAVRERDALQTLLEETTGLLEQSTSALVHEREKENVGLESPTIDTPTKVLARPSGGRVLGPRNGAFGLGLKVSSAPVIPTPSKFDMPLPDTPDIFFPQASKRLSLDIPGDGSPQPSQDSPTAFFSPRLFQRFMTRKAPAKHQSWSPISAAENVPSSPLL